MMEKDEYRFMMSVSDLPPDLDYLMDLDPSKNIPPARAEQEDLMMRDEEEEMKMETFFVERLPTVDNMRAIYGFKQGEECDNDELQQIINNNYILNLLADHIAIHQHSQYRLDSHFNYNVLDGKRK